jgi:hypothetical protein
VRSSFEEFIETNLMVQSEFNLIFWFVSYNIFFCYRKKWGPLLHSLPLSLRHSLIYRTRSLRGGCAVGTLRQLDLPDEHNCWRIPDGIADAAAGFFFYATCVYRIHIADPVQIVLRCQHSPIVVHQIQRFIPMRHVVFSQAHIHI